MKLPALNVLPLIILNVPDRFQLEEGVIPATFVLLIFTAAKDVGEPNSVIAPAPPKYTLPVFEKFVPKLIVLAVDGIKLIVPVLVTVPLFVNDPLIICDEIPPKNDAPVLTVMPCSTVHPTLGLTPPVLFILRKPN